MALVRGTTKDAHRFTALMALLLAGTALTLLPHISVPVPEVLNLAPKRFMTPWQITTETGATLDSRNLLGSFYILGFLPATCDPLCVTSQRELLNALEGLSMTGPTIRAVMISTSEKAPPPALPPSVEAAPGPPMWTRAHASRAQIKSMRNELNAFRPSKAIPLNVDDENSFTLFVFDSRGVYRGDWGADEQSRKHLMTVLKAWQRYASSAL